ncbi:hypothetical protein L218DRAFT_989859 [Marasmius fiardii PR-910]|nr:hypothetical protein L218DRAFT_989859 [Marasmius fiardii PR-910]
MWSTRPVEDIGIYLSTTDGPKWDTEGGPWGDAFNTMERMSITSLKKAKLQRISMRSGYRIDAISCSYDLGDGKSEFGMAGGQGGSEPQLFELGPGEFITRVEGHVNNDDISQLQFFTNKIENGKERSSPSYGDNSSKAGRFFKWLPPKVSSASNTPAPKADPNIIDEGLDVLLPPDILHPSKVDSTTIKVGLFGFEGLQGSRDDATIIKRLTPIWKVIQ